MEAGLFMNTVSIIWNRQPSQFRIPFMCIMLCNVIKMASRTFYGRRCHDGTVLHLGNEDDVSLGSELKSIRFIKDEGTSHTSISENSKY